MKRVFLFALACLLLLASLPAFAQDGALSPEKQALLDRALAANLTLNSYESYVKNGIEQSYQEFAILAEGTVVDQQISRETTENLTAVVRGAAPNGFYAEFRTVTEGEETYLMQGELRYVEGVIYGSGTYLEGTGPYVFPQGFITITNPADAGEFSVFDPEDFVNEIDGIPAQDNPFTNLDQYQTSIADVISEPSMVDGQPVEMITIIISNDGLLTLLNTLDDAEEPDPTLAAMLSFLSEGSGASISFAIAPDGNILQGRADVLMEIIELDMSQVDSTIPAGTLANIRVELSLQETYSQINQVTSLVAAP